MANRVVIALILIMNIFDSAIADNWPQWRGPSLDGISQEKRLPLLWNRKRNITWELVLPSFSGSTPIVWDESIFLNVADGSDLYLWCINRNNGELKWKKFLGSGNVKNRKHNMSSPSPVTDGKSVFVMTGTGVLKGFDFNGNPLWTRDIPKDYGQLGMNFGYGSSPLLYRESLYIQVLHGMFTDDPSYVLRINSKNGQTIWKKERKTDAVHESPDSYSTPTVANTDRGTELIVTGGDCVTGHNLENGKELWRVNGFNPNNSRNYRVVASPVAMKDLVYVPTRVRPLIAIRPGGTGDVTESHSVWKFQNGPDVPTPVVDNTYFYSVSDNGVMWCLDAKSGKRIWGGNRLKPGTYTASPVLADGKIYISNEDGLTTVIKTGPTFKILAENPLNDYCLSSPAISDGQIFIRTAERLFCIGQRTNNDDTH
ncbi:MAG: PQQ-binding-like beta-propeller repeat protein [Acidobacteriia bacterium]|nr:PQQ-binding-like beta-propeller repeat protein [Terriglobia bacterium]